LESGFLAQFALRRRQRLLIEPAAAHRDFPQWLPQGVTKLTHQPGMTVGVDGDYANRSRFEMHDTVNALGAGRRHHFLMAHAQPGIVVNGTTADAPPWPDIFVLH